MRIVVLTHTDADWTGYQDLPEACRNDFDKNKNVTPEEIKQIVSSIPTLFKIKTACHGALLAKAAQKVVAKQRQHIVDFLQTAP